MAEDRDPLLAGPLELPGESARKQAHLHPKRRSFPTKKLSITLFVLGLVAFGYGAYRFISKTGTVNEATQPNSSAPEQEAPLVTNDVPAAGEMKQHKSSQPRMEFSYPASWTVAEKENGVRITSPAFTYTTVDGSELEGHFRIYIRQTARTADSKYIGAGVACLPSEKISYSDPVVGQRSKTNLSFFGLDTTDHFAYFFVAGNFSLKKGQSLGPDYGKEPETYIIAGGYAAPDLTDDLATHKVPLDYFQTTQAYAQAIGIITSLKLL